MRWKGKVFGLDADDLKEALPKKGVGVLIRAGRETPYEHVVKLLDLLKPVFGNNVRFAMGEEEAGGAAKEPAERPAPQGRLAELEAQIAECQLELNRLQLELVKLPDVLEKHDPQLRKTKNRIGTVEAYLKDLRLARNELNAAGGSFVPNGGPGLDLLLEEVELLELQASGLGEKHPKIRQAEQSIRELGKRFPKQDREVKRVQLRWAWLELRKAESRTRGDEEFRLRGEASQGCHEKDSNRGLAKGDRSTGCQRAGR